MKEHFKKYKKAYRKALIWLGSIIVMVLIIKAIIKWQKDQEKKSAGTGGNTLGTTASKIINSLNKNLVLAQGSNGTEVMFLQKILNDAYGANLTVDGNFGSNTLNALQTHTGLSSVTLNTIYSAVGAVQAGISGISQQAAADGIYYAMGVLMLQTSSEEQILKSLWPQFF
jgi:hypothetical protein